jgi:hypothetical protein
MELAPDFDEFVESLIAHGVEFVIVDAYALAFHGAPRFTGDLDILVRPTLDNASRLLAALEAFGFPVTSLTPETITDPRRMLEMGVPPVQIHVMSAISGVAWDEAWAERRGPAGPSARSLPGTSNVPAQQAGGWPTQGSRRYRRTRAGSRCLRLSTPALTPFEALTLDETALTSIVTSGSGDADILPSMDLAALPGGDLIVEGLRDLDNGRETAAALLVLIGEPRLRALGLEMPSITRDGTAETRLPEHRLYALLAADDDNGAHSRYNALIRTLVSFERAAECVS